METDQALAQLEERKEKALRMGGEERIARQHARGSLTARERILGLLDPDSFLEVGLLTHSDIPGMADKTAADGKVCGFGAIDGRPVAVKANDPTVLAGAGGRVGHRKAARLAHAAWEKGYPVITLGEAGGARIPDIQGSDGLSSLTPGRGYATRARRVPAVAAVMGDCFGDPSWEAALADFVVQVKGTCLAVSSPRVLEIAKSEQVDNEALGGWKMHAKLTGLVDRAAEDEQDCFRLIRRFLSFMPSSAEDLPPRGPGDPRAGERRDKFMRVLPAKSNQVYDMNRLLKILVDDGDLFHLKPDYDKSVITCLARLDGRPVGIIANQPLHNGGAMGAEGCNKCTGFIALCDSFHLPLLFLHDTPGFLVGPDAEKKGMPGRIINFIQALGLATVPKISLVVRKSYGMAYSNMCGAGMGADFLYAWPTADISFMAPEVAANVVHAAKIAASEDPEQARSEAVEAMRLGSAPWQAAAMGYLDDVIDPRDTREVILRSLELARGGSGGRSQRLMATWPTNF